MDRTPILTIDAASRALAQVAEPDRVPVLGRYFQTQAGGYGEGDRFRGVRVPEVRRIARRCTGMQLDVVSVLLRAAHHEDRLLAALVLVERYRRSATDRERYVIRATYLSGRAGVNNWDIVDTSAPGIVGLATLSEGPSLLNALAYSDRLWDRRMAMIATLAHIRAGHHDTALEIADILLEDGHDLIRKAVGWMVREVWQRDAGRAEAFLSRNLERAPKLVLRYATERMSLQDRARLADG
jgi:3-methyladenine DNA glycosylase AlkD